MADTALATALANAQNSSPTGSGLTPVAAVRSAYHSRRPTILKVTAGVSERFELRVRTPASRRVGSRAPSGTARRRDQVLGRRPDPHVIRPPRLSPVRGHPPACSHTGTPAYVRSVRCIAVAPHRTTRHGVRCRSSPAAVAVRPRRANCGGRSRWACPRRPARRRATSPARLSEPDKPIPGGSGFHVPLTTAEREENPMDTTEDKQPDSKPQPPPRVDPSDLPNPYVWEERSRFFPSKQKRSAPRQ